MDVFELLMIAVVVGAAAALWFLYRKPSKVTYQGRSYRRMRDGGFRDDAGQLVTDASLVAALQSEHERLLQAREARIASAAED